MATEATTTQEKRPPQPSTPVVLVHLQHRTQESRFGSRRINSLNFVGLPQHKSIASVGDTMQR